MWVIKVFSGDRRRPIAARTSGDLLLAGPRRRRWVPAMTRHQSSAYRISR